MSRMEKILETSSATTDIPCIDHFRDKTLVLFGASSDGISAFNRLSSNNINIDYFCDNDPQKWGKKLCGIEIIPPRKLAEMNRETNIIVSSMYFSEIAVQLKNENFKNVYDIRAVKPSAFAKFFDRDYIIENSENILELYSLLSDERSKKVLENIINYRLTFDPLYIQAIISKDQYFPSDIVTLNSQEVFVDGGAFTGDTISNFAKATNNEFFKIFAFEPDYRNYESLKKYIEEKGLTEKVIPINYGLLDKSTKMSFLSSEIGSSSQINNSGSVTVNTVSIDEYLKNENITYIKMDIEGAEIPALLGAKNTIIRNEPKLAICVYHKPNDLWEIPLLIKSFVPRHKIYLRHHSGSILESVCYAIG